MTPFSSVNLPACTDPDQMTRRSPAPSVGRTRYFSTAMALEVVQDQDLAVLQALKARLGKP
jgi:hypothetical protein